jgi:hypothetical protein
LSLAHTLWRNKKRQLSTKQVNKIRDQFVNDAKHLGQFKINHSMDHCLFPRYAQFVTLFIVDVLTTSFLLHSGNWHQGMTNHHPKQ